MSNKKRLLYFTLREVYETRPTRIAINLKEYDHGDSFPFDYKPNRIQFGSYVKIKTVATIIFLEIWRNHKHISLSTCFEVNIYV